MSNCKSDRRLAWSYASAVTSPERAKRKTRSDEGLAAFRLARLTTIELLALTRAILSELKDRGVIRSGNAPTGDYAELLVKLATDGQLAPNSQKGWDLETAAGDRLQVKARVVTNPRTAANASFRPSPPGASTPP
jgi:hypothetical protein